MTLRPRYTYIGTIVRIVDVIAKSQEDAALSDRSIPNEHNLDHVVEGFPPRRHLLSTFIDVEYYSNSELRLINRKRLSYNSWFFQF
jgi:hypothetical protein